MEKIRVCFVTNELDHGNFPPTGGIGVFIKTLSENLYKNGIDVHILGFNGKNSTSSKDGVNLKTIHLGKIENINTIIDLIDNTFILKNILRVSKVFKFFKIKYYKKIAETVKAYSTANNINIIEFNDYLGYGAYMDKNKNYSIVIRLHGSKTVLNSIYKIKEDSDIKFFEKKAIENSDILIAVSKFSKEQAKNEFNIKKDIEICYNGVNI
ncbi:hypothetical protein NFHSH190041_02880 [Shewanella sp. NFH-SH190041]|uniref:glycosyltransferase n=1 Tax=Shewanella sp. NFH-SH190041 TaxID=2950245 RepID=UPI0021C2BC45|nr:glycosyltransferase [Shewanella sp. NFH-SH190041]BDM62836.1 hypothetical protein NFHSH190041_02880 [Shewanella sp. NFH-SH190041]